MEWRKLHNEKHYDMYFSQNNFAGDKIEQKEIEGGHVACVWDRSCVYRVGKRGGKTPMGRNGSR